MTNEKQLRVALYARVSTRDKGQNPELQLSELRDYAKARGWQVIGQFVDVGVSGSKDSRPKLDGMMRLAKARKLDVIAVWKLDRFGRSLRHLVDALAELEAVGVAFVSLRDNLDLSTPSRRALIILQASIIAAAAYYVLIGLSCVLRGKIYPSTGTMPAPNAGLTIGSGAATMEPRCVFFLS